MVEIELVPLFTPHQQVGPFRFTFDVSLDLCGAGAWPQVGQSTVEMCVERATHLVRQPVPGRDTGHESTRCVFGKVCREHLALRWPHGTTFIALAPDPGHEETWLEAWERVTMGLYGKVYSSMSQRAARRWKGQQPAMPPITTGVAELDEAIADMQYEVEAAAIAMGGLRCIAEVKMSPLTDEIRWTLVPSQAAVVSVGGQRNLSVTPGNTLNVILPLGGSAVTSRSPSAP